uniref:Epg5-like TPR domain-containing protein n=1 Tax=Bombyx mori TaxID=7091 RepID=A0A8R2QW08_BOMMO|nr:uncharacterized protein LOC110385041 isoform X2 [Bombyx mori]
MATMIKEKRREKKKTKEKLSSKSTDIQLSESDVVACPSSDATISQTLELVIDTSDKTSTVPIKVQDINVIESKSEIKISERKLEMVESKNVEEVSENSKTMTETYKELNSKLERLIIPNQCFDITEQREYELAHPDAYNTRVRDCLTNESSNYSVHTNEESIAIEESGINNIGLAEALTPSAPMLEEKVHKPPQQSMYEVPEKVEEPRVKCIPLEEAINLFARKEFELIKSLSEKEETIVEAGPSSGPEHPLVDLLSTFSSSLRAVERERTKITLGFIEEESSRSRLWLIEKRYIKAKEQCRCGAKVYVQAWYEHAQLLKEKLPAAKLTLEGLLRDITDSYCHHQHEALLAHCEIEELLSEIVKSSKSEIREALSLVLQALKLSDSSPTVLSIALLRWARALSTALLEGSDVRQLLFLIHHLFRQSHSVEWASSFINLAVQDSVSAAQMIALLDILLALPKATPEPALECTEESEDAWEEVDKHGAGGAVSEGKMREKDMLSLLNAFPLRDLVARLVAITHADIKQVRESEWVDRGGGGAVLRACAGVRTWLHVLRRAAARHVHYTRLRAALAHLARAAMTALCSLHMRSRHLYRDELKEKIDAELEAVFAEGVSMSSASELPALPAALLGRRGAMDYCVCHAVSLHAVKPKPLESLSMELPVLPCESRVKIIAHAAINRAHDEQLAKFVLEFLIQIGNQRKTEECKGACDKEAQKCLPTLLAAHPHLYTTALHTLAQLNEREPVDAAAVAALGLSAWRPRGDDVTRVLDDWAGRRAPLSLLLLQLDYTPHTGMSLETQLSICSWLVSYAGSGPAPEWCWAVLRRSALHGALWGRAADPPPPPARPTEPFAIAFQLLSSSWGHSIPLICAEGVGALCELAAARPRDAACCLAPLLLVMAHSPESVSLTPKFAELFSILLNARPTLVQRTLGRGGVAGSEILLRLFLEQLENHDTKPTSASARTITEARCRSYNVSRAAVLSVWLHALWRGPPAALAVLDAGAVLCQHWAQLDDHATAMLQDGNAKEITANAVSNAATAPLLCECVLRAAHARTQRTHAHALLLAALRAQHAARQRIHVDNALQQIGLKMSSEELVIYRAGNAVLSAPPQHPAHLTLWRLFMHLYLERVSANANDPCPAAGPLFYSGIIKTRSLGHIKKRLQELAAHHKAEADKIKEILSDKVEIKSAEIASTSQRADGELFKDLTIADLTGESSDSDSGEGEWGDGEGDAAPDNTTRNTDFDVSKIDLSNYYIGAHKMMLMYLRWLEDGERVTARQHHADLTSFMTQQCLEAGWRHALRQLRPPPASEPDPPPAPVAADPPKSQFAVGLDSILSIGQKSRKRRRKNILKPVLEDVEFKDTHRLISAAENHLNKIKLLAKEWSSETDRVRALDVQLWVLLGSLRARRPLPPVSRQCANKCPPVSVRLNAEEWCISAGVERSIRENRCTSRKSVSRLSRPRPHAARTAAALYSIVKRIDSMSSALCVVERVWAAAAACPESGPAHAALHRAALVLAERWVSRSGATCASLVQRWSAGAGSALQAALCVAVVAPRLCRPWPPLYCALLRTSLPDYMLFSALSKFEMNHLSKDLELTERRELLDSLLVAAQRWGPTSESYPLSSELLGMHMQALMEPGALCGHTARCMRAAAAGALPAPHWRHVARAVETSAGLVPFDQLSRLPRELGALWWEARTAPRPRGVQYAVYSEEIARVYRLLLKALVDAAVELSYAPERVAACGWSALLELWSPWVQPHPAPPLLPAHAQDDSHATMLKSFADALLQTMRDCPGTESYILQKTYEWIVHTQLNVNGQNQSECRVQVSELLAELAALPWDRHQWFSGNCIELAVQWSACGDKQAGAWTGAVTSRTAAGTLLAPHHDSPVRTLVALLYFFTATDVPHSEQILDEAMKLPWWRLPELALDEACSRFFAFHHNPEKPYHELPQFKVLVQACGAGDGAGGGAEGRVRRGVLVAHWARAAAAPALLAHVPAHAAAMLKLITQIALYLKSPGDEVEELVSRAVAALCAGPAAARVLPVWERHVREACVRVRRACVRAACSLTAFPHFAALSDAAIKAFLAHPESSGWSEMRAAWAGCPWTEPRALAGEGALHAAYVCTLAAPAPAPARALHALLARQHSLYFTVSQYRRRDNTGRVDMLRGARGAVRGAGGAGGGAGAAAGVGGAPAALRAQRRHVPARPRTHHQTSTAESARRVPAGAVGVSDSRVQGHQCRGVRFEAGRGRWRDRSSHPRPAAQTRGQIVSQIREVF